MEAIPKQSSKMLKSVFRITLIVFAAYLAFVALVYFRQRSLLYFPSHATDPSGLKPWSVGGQTIGYCREVPQPQTIWLMTHGNAGQAAGRDYVLPHLSDHDSLYVLEYPGYGQRAGSPSKSSMNQAASTAYQTLRQQNPTVPVCVVAESIGSGPACALAQETNPPDKIVLIVPFDTLASVAAEHFPFLPARLLLRDNWNNVESLRQYHGPIDIFGALDDTIIPIAHARALARQIPQARFIAITGGHNAWSSADQLKISR
jgi:pimeloyl-ACP methyl ester carboxylesterase